MTKEEWRVKLKEAQDNLNNLVDAARADNHTVNLSVVGKGPTSLISTISVELPDTSV